MAAIPLTNGAVAIVDDADAPGLSRFRWHLFIGPSGKKYAKCSREFMHRLLMNPPPDMEVDHRDGDGLNNQRSNLRVATSQQNNANRRGQRDVTSPYKGVHWVANVNKWSASITCGRHTWKLGYGDDPIELARLYDTAARLLHGEFAFQNFPIAKEVADRANAAIALELFGEFAKTNAQLGLLT